VPMSVKVAFAIGAFVFLASIMVTLFTTKEYPPEDLEEFEREKQASAGFLNGLKQILQSIFTMPPTMLKLGVVQFFSWFAFFGMWSMATPALTEHVFKSPIPVSETYDTSIESQALALSEANASYNDAADLVGSYMGVYGLSSMGFAFLLTLYTAKFGLNRRLTHMLSLFAGGAGFILMYYIPSPEWLILCFALIGISWGSILSMPYAMLSSSIDPDKMGIYMGIFNMFIVIPQIIAATGGLNFLYKGIFGEAAIFAMVLAGVSLILAGLSNFLLTNPKVIRDIPQ
jgi:maltose/moltooligosaccharide transporter